jgi:hypothetical protein
MISPEGRHESLDDTIDRLAIDWTSMLSRKDFHYVSAWLCCYERGDARVFMVNVESSYAIYDDALPRLGVIELRRRIADRVKMFLASRGAEIASYDSREICKACFHVNPVGFHVPDHVWHIAAGDRFKDSVLCLACFCRLADEKLVP